MGVFKPMNHLLGKNILLTRTAEQNHATATLVAALGATPFSLACSHIQPLPNNIQTAWEQLNESNPQTTDVIFSSANGVGIVANTAPDFTNTLAAYTVVSVGNKTNQALEQYNVSPAWTAEQSSQKGLIQGYKTRVLPQTAFFFRAETGADCLLNHLEKQGVKTHLIPTYRAEMDNTDATAIIQQLKDNTIDAVLLGSARTAAFYVQKIGNVELANHPTVVVMSQQVRKAADKLGLSVQVIAETPSFESMLKGLDNYFTHHEKG